MTPAEDECVELSRADLIALCHTALIATGALQDQAGVLAEATVQAELRRHTSVGLSHLLDHLDGFRTGRIAATTPVITAKTPVIVSVDCRKGLAQHGFQVIQEQLTEAASLYGVGVATVHNCFTAGELDHYVRHLNSRGQLGVAVANSPALMSAAGAGAPIFGTNPLAFGVPLPGGDRLCFDQAASATAWVAIRDAADRDEQIPSGWAVDRHGRSTTSAREALAGALLPAGGYKGGNVALLVEVLATLAGGQFSSDAAPFQHGSRSPAVGLFVIAIDCAAIQPDYPAQLAARLDRWRVEAGADPSVWTGVAEASHCLVSRSLLTRLGWTS